MPVFNFKTKVRFQIKPGKFQDFGPGKAEVPEEIMNLSVMQHLGSVVETQPSDFVPPVDKEISEKKTPEKVAEPVPTQSAAKPTQQPIVPPKK